MGNMIGTLLHLYSLCVFIRVLLTWVQHDPHHPAIAFLCQITDPFLDFFRGVLPAKGGMDISPIIGLILLQIVASAFGHM